MGLPIKEAEEQVIGELEEACRALVSLFKNEKRITNASYVPLVAAVANIKKATDRVLRFNELAEEFRDL